MDFGLFAAIDRRCRHARPRVRDLRDRAILLERMGLPEAAKRDADTLVGLTHLDLRVLLWVMEQHGDADVRRDAARTIVASDRATTRERDAATAYLIGLGERLVLVASRHASTVAGWVAWAGPDTPSLSWITSVGTFGEATLPTDPLQHGGDHVRRQRFAIAAPGDVAIEIVAKAGEWSSRPVAVPPDRPSLGEPARLVSADLTIILPVFGDPSSLTLCLDALRPQLAPGIQLVVIDDASPDPLVSSLAERFTRNVGGLYHRLPVNAGFASAVNAGLASCPAGDVLILNSDVILPALALVRLRAAARSDHDIATVSPFSSDAGSVTFPDRKSAGDVSDPLDRLAIDRVAGVVNAGIVVDILAAHGSCLYVTRRMREVVGALALSFGRGYYEDIDFVLRAREHGLRNVAACDVFVTHLGSRSFGPAKHALIARNHAELCRRFPDYERDEIAFDIEDPLNAARAAIERQAPVPIDTSVLLIAPAYSAEALVRQRQSHWKDHGRGCCVARLRGVGPLARLEFGVTSGLGPRSLRFAVDGAGCLDMVDYLSLWPGHGPEIEILRPDDVLQSLGEALIEAGHSVFAVVDSRSSASVATAWRDRAEAGPASVGRRGAATRAPRATPAPGLRVLDRVSARAVGPHRAEDSRAEGRPGALEADRQAVRPARPVLGVLYPSPGMIEEAFILGLARRMKRRSAIQILVLGFAIDEAQLASPGNVWVSGLQHEEDPAEVLSHYGVRAVLSPYRTSHVWYLDDVASRLDVPGAFFDWCPAGSAPRRGRLALDADLAASDAYGLLEPWIACAAQTAVSAAP